MVIAVVVYVAAGSRLRVVRQRLMRLRADRDFVLRARGLGCSLLSLGWCCCRLRLRHCVDWLNRLNGIAHADHLIGLNVGQGRINFSVRLKKVRGNGNCSERKLCGLVRGGGRALRFSRTGFSLSGLNFR